MKREVWPEGYRIPNWIRNLTDRMPSLGHLWLQGFLAGILSVSALAFMLTFRDEDGRRVESIINPDWISWIALVGVIVTGLLVIAMSRNTSERELWLSALKEKARADSLAKQWSGHEVAELRNCWKWSVNYWENAADELFEDNKKHWIKRWFNKKRGKVILPDETVFYGLLIKEVEDRITAGKSDLRSSVSAQIEAAVERLNQFEQQALGLLWKESELAFEQVEVAANACEYDWSEISHAIKLAGHGAILDSMREVLGFDRGEWALKWREIWPPKWGAIMLAKRDALNKSYAHASLCDEGRRMEISFLSMDNLTEEQQLKWEAIAIAHDERLQVLEAERKQAYYKLLSFALHSAAKDT